MREQFTFYRSAIFGLTIFALAASACASSSSSSQPDTQSESPPAAQSESQPNSLTAAEEIGSGLEPSTDESPQESAPKVDREVVAAVAEWLGVELLVAGLDDDTALVWRPDGMVEITTPNRSNLWSDGQFLYRERRSADESTRGGDPDDATYVAMTFDGEVVCHTDERLHHAARRTDGAYVMAIEQPWDEMEPDAEATPMEAVDCQNGERQPIEPVSFSLGESQSRSIISMAGRTFTSDGDAEGNADVENEQGVSINGDDYAGYHTFSPNGSLVAYGDMSNNPHRSRTVVVRNTTTGEQLWRHEFDIEFSHLIGFTAEESAGSNMVVGFIDESDRREEAYGTREQERVIDRVVVLDALTGEVLGKHQVGFNIVYLH